MRYSVSILALLAGCSVVPEVQNDPRFAPAVAPMRQEAKPTNGSLFQPSSMMSLYTDEKAHQVGDLITVILSEVTESKKAAQSKIQKDNTSTVTNPTIFGTNAQVDLPKEIGPVSLATNKGLGLGASLASSLDFDGKTKADQKNKLTGTITVTVAQVLPNNNLVVRGEKWFTLTHGDEYIRISGIIRPKDINPDNTILSNRIADARIAYSGTGSLSETTVPGWLTRFFNSRYWPF